MTLNSLQLNSMRLALERAQAGDWLNVPAKYLSVDTVLELVRAIEHLTALVNEIHGLRIDNEPPGPRDLYGHPDCHTHKDAYGFGYAARQYEIQQLIRDRC